MSFLRKKVSRNKRRYQKNGFDLDLSYITDRLIAMGFPSESVEGVYRNPFKEVFRFLELNHKDHYKVYNLCSERGYDIAKFHNRVECFPFDDHNSPPIELIDKFCKNVEEWLHAHEKNVAVVHCKAGKGRTGLMICCYLLYSGEWKVPAEALQFYGALRTYNKKGVTIPSQIRYINYFGHVVANGKLLPATRPLLLEKVEFAPAPKLSTVLDIRFSVYVNKTLVYAFKDQPKLKSNKTKVKSIDLPDNNNNSQSNNNSTEEDEEILSFELSNPVPLVGDIKMDFYEKETFGSDRLLAFWFNTSFVPSNGVLVLPKSELDKAHKDHGHKTYRETFRVACHFAAMDETPSFLSTASPVSSSTPSPSTSGTSPVAPPTISIVDNDSSVGPLESMEREQGVLNRLGSVSGTGSKRQPVDVAEELLERLIEIYIGFSAESGEISSREKLSQQFLDKSPNTNVVSVNSKEFRVFSLSTCELQKVTLDGFSHEEKLAFWVNVYHLLTLHATLLSPAQPAKKTAEAVLEDRFVFASKAKYEIGGQVYSLLDIEFNILRSKGTLPDLLAKGNLLKKFDKKDPRFPHQLSNPEPRLNFVLNWCGSKESSPLIRIHHRFSIFEELERATRNFLQDNVHIDSNKKKIVISKLFDSSWYGKDFGKKPEKLVGALHEYLPLNNHNGNSGPDLTTYAVEFKDFDTSFFYSFKHFIVNSDANSP